VSDNAFKIMLPNKNKNINMNSNLLSKHEKKVLSLVKERTEIVRKDVERMCLMHLKLCLDVF